MADVEIVIKALEYCIEHNCSQCFYREQCSKTGVKRDAIELLKDKEAKVEIEGGGSTWFYVCGECHTSINPYEKYCRECGRRLIWDDKR